MRFWGLVLAISLTGGIAMTNNVTESATGKPPSKVLRHVVLYKFKNDLAPEKVQEVVDAFVGLSKKIDKIVGFEHGTNVSQEGKSEGLTHCFVVTFRDEMGRATYLDHAAHQEFVKLVRERREKVVVFDYWADE
jgi:hypothetical protein